MYIYLQGRRRCSCQDGPRCHHCWRHSHLVPTLHLPQRMFNRCVQLSFRRTEMQSGLRVMDASLKGGGRSDALPWRNRFINVQKWPQGVECLGRDQCDRTAIPHAPRRRRILTSPCWHLNCTWGESWFSLVTFSLCPVFFWLHWRS